MQVEHKTEKGTVIFVQVPENTIGCGLNLFNNVPHIQLRFDKHPYGGSISIGRKKVEFNPWQLIGLTSEVTEEQAKMMVDNIFMDCFKDYINPVKFKYVHPLDSFKSLMQHLQVYDSIPKRGEINTQRTGRWIVLFKEN